MTTQTHRKTIAAAAVIGALAIAAPASAASDQQPSTTPAPTAAHPFSGQGGQQPSTTPTPTSAHPLSGQGVPAGRRAPS